MANWEFHFRNFDLNVELPAAGTYGVQVTGWDPLSTTGSYVLRVTFEPAPLAVLLAIVVPLMVMLPLADNASRSM